jgi:hypothetical protein
MVLYGGVPYSSIRDEKNYFKHTSENATNVDKTSS